MAPKGGAQRKREREKMGKRGKERMCEETESRETKMSGLYWEEPSGKSSPNPRLESLGLGVGYARWRLRNAGRTWSPGLLWYVKHAPQPLIRCLKPNLEEL